MLLYFFPDELSLSGFFILVLRSTCNVRHYTERLQKDRYTRKNVSIIVAQYGDALSSVVILPAAYTDIRLALLRDRRITF